jgi:hypothetical protein
MANPEQFWQQLHTIAESYDHLASTSQERSSEAVRQFKEINPQARQELLSDLFRLATHLPDLYAAVAAAERAADDKNWKRQRGHVA